MTKPETHLGEPLAPGGGGGEENWQLIATAPKDGQDILGATLNFGRQLVIRWRVTAPGVGAWVATDSDREVHPTHWTELPKPPGVLPEDALWRRRKPEASDADR